MPCALSAPVNASAVNWLPWSLLKISGMPWVRKACSKQSTQNPLSSVFETRQASTLRLYPSITATQYSKPPRQPNVSDVGAPDGVGPANTRQPALAGQGQRPVRADPALDLEQARRLFLQLLLPLPHLPRMHPELLGNRIDRLDVPDRLKCDLRLELASENLAFLLAHNNPRFAEGHPLK
jgi:hypothetical protein